jgi:hypothetical protein
VVVEGAFAAEGAAGEGVGDVFDESEATGRAEGGVGVIAVGLDADLAMPLGADGVIEFDEDAVGVVAGPEDGGVGAAQAEVGPPREIDEARAQG